MEKELISIIVPVYNIKEYLERCMESICCQTYNNLEILMVDDGSTDGTSELCDEIAGRDNRIRVFHKRNGGSSSARNLGIENAAGVYMGFVDSDDYIEPDMYTKLYEALKICKARMAQGSREEIDAAGNRLPDICIPPERTSFSSAHDFMEELLLHRGDCSFCTKLTERSLFENHRFPEGVLNEDFHVLVQMLPEISGIAMIPDRVYHVFYKKDSNTRKVSASEFSRVYGDNVDNAEMVEGIVQERYPDLADTAVRFGLYQRLDYLLHIPIAQMVSDHMQYIQIVRYLRQHRFEIRHSKNLTRRNKIYLMLFSFAPRQIRQLHAWKKGLKRDHNERK